MKKYIFLFAVLSSCYNILAQTPTFNGNFIFRQPLDDENITQTIEVGDGYLLAGTSYTWNNVYSPFDSRLVILKMDFYGNVTRKVIYGDSGYAYSTTYRKGILINADGKIVLLLNLMSGYYDNHIILMELTRDGDSVITREIIKPAGYEGFLFPTALTQTADKGYAIAAYYGYTGAIIKTDSTGVVEWIKLLGENSIHSVVDGISVVSLHDTGVLAGYYVYDSQGGGAGHSGIVCKFDKQGNYKWSREIGPPDYFFQDQVLPAVNGDSSIMIFTDYFIPNSSTDKRFEILKLNPDGSVIWDRNIGTNHNNIILYDVAQLKDSTWLICGSLSSGKSFILNVNSDADSLFYREYTLSSSDRSSGEQRLIYHHFYTVTGTLDDGLLMAGGTSGNNSSDQDPWILKTDRYGCMQPGCEPHAIYIMGQPTSVELCPGDSAWTSVSATGDSPSYQWQIFMGNHWQNINDDSLYAGSQTDSLKAKYSKELAGNFKIRCRIRNQWFTEYSNEAGLRRLEPAGIGHQPENQYVHLHGSVAFSVQPSGSGPFHFQWYWKDKPVADATDSIFIIEDVVEEDIPGPYHCIVGNNCNETESSSASIMINTEGIYYPDRADPVVVYPIPAKGSITIKPDHKLLSGFEIRLIDLAGVTVYKCTTGETEVTLNVTGLPAGIYFLELKSEMEILVRKVILQ
jgi:hypothetical protein